MRLLRYKLYQLLHYIGAVAYNLVIYFYILVYLRRIDIYMKYLCVGSKGLGIAYYSVGKACSYADKQIAVLYCLCRRFCAVHTEHTHIALVCLVKAALSHKRRGYRSVDKLCKLFKGFCSLFSVYASACVKERTLGAFNKLRRFCNTAVLVHCNADRIRLYRLVDKIRLLRRDVLRHIYKHRTFSSASCYVKSLTDSIRQLVYVLDYEVMLCNRHSYACYINFLEAVESEQRAGDISGYRYHRHAVHICRSYACYKVCRTGTGCCYNNACLAC